MTQPRRRKANRGALTPRQRDVMECAIRGLDGYQTAEELGTTYDTVRTHRSTILRRMHCRTFVEAAVKYERERAETEARAELLRAIEREVSA